MNVSNTVNQPNQRLQPNDMLQKAQHKSGDCRRKKVTGGQRAKRKRASNMSTPRTNEPKVENVNDNERSSVKKVAKSAQGQQRANNKSNKQKQKKKNANAQNKTTGNPFDLNLDNSTGNKTNQNKKQSKNAPENNKPTPSTPTPSKRVVCAAERGLMKCIDQKLSLDNSGSQTLVDLPKDQINTLPEIPYKKTKNAVVVLSDAASSDRAVANIRNELSRNQRRLLNGSTGKDSFQFLGFDTETRPKFHKGGIDHPPALIQLATQTTAYLFRLTFQGMNPNASPTMTESLLSLLSDPNVIKVGIGIHKDVEDLKRVYGQGCCGEGASYLDLGPLVKLRWPKIQRAGLRNLTATVLQFKLSKAQQMKNWEMKRLTPAMEAYAAADALVALDLLAAIVG